MDQEERGLWISRKRFVALERKVAAIEREQLLVADNIKSNKELLKVITGLREELSRVKIIDTNTTE